MKITSMEKDGTDSRPIKFELEGELEFTIINI